MLSETKVFVENCCNATTWGQDHGPMDLSHTESGHMLVLRPTLPFASIWPSLPFRGRRHVLFLLFRNTTYTLMDSLQIGAGYVYVFICEFMQRTRQNDVVHRKFSCETY